MEYTEKTFEERKENIFNSQTKEAAQYNTRRLILKNWNMILKISSQNRLIKKALTQNPFYCNLGNIIPIKIL